MLFVSSFCDAWWQVFFWWYGGWLGGQRWTSQEFEWIAQFFLHFTLESTFSPKASQTRPNSSWSYTRGCALDPPQQFTTPQNKVAYPWSERKTHPVGYKYKGLKSDSMIRFKASAFPLVMSYLMNVNPQIPTNQTVWVSTIPGGFGRWNWRFQAPKAAF